MEEQTKGPLFKSRSGKFQATIWKRRKVIPANDARYQPEREIEIVRACIQYSRYNWQRREYDRQLIWCDPHELRDLANALDLLGSDGGDA